MSVFNEYNQANSQAGASYFRRLLWMPQPSDSGHSTHVDLVYLGDSQLISSHIQQDRNTVLES